MSRDYLTVDYILQIHAEQIERYGGSDGVRDRAGLEAAVARPQSGYYESVIQEAAALWESLSQNHPFVDGNKRVAFSATNRFLGLNDMQITASPDQAFAFISDAFERKQMKFETLEAWLSVNTKTRDELEESRSAKLSDRSMSGRDPRAEQLERLRSKASDLGKATDTDKGGDKLK